MPIVEVTYASEVPQKRLMRLVQALPHAVSTAVECAEEPYDRELKPGDVEIRCHALGKYDLSGLDFVVEVRSKWFKSRADNRQERCDGLRDILADVVDGRSIGVFLTLPPAAWSQTD